VGKFSRRTIGLHSRTWSLVDKLELSGVDPQRVRDIEDRLHVRIECEGVFYGHRLPQFFSRPFRGSWGRVASDKTVQKLNGLLSELLQVAIRRV
jgi:hypothetical protein